MEKANEVFSYQTDWAKRTFNFRQKVLELSSECSGPIPWHATQHILDQLWEGNAEPIEKNSIIQYGCQECGSILHPGYNGTTLRVKRHTGSVSRSQRRRHQRRQKKQALLELKKPKDHNRKLNEHPPGEVKRFVLLEGDTRLDMERHHLALRCGHCDSKVCLKGLRRQKSPVESAKAKGSMKVAARAVAETKNPPKSASSLDFIELPSTAPKRPPMNLEQAFGQKKKKKKPPQAKKSKLMDFLSSLND